MADCVGVSVSPENSIHSSTKITIIKRRTHTTKECLRKSLQLFYFFFFVPKNGKIGDLLRFCIALVIANVECGFFLVFITYEVLKPFLLLNFVHKIGCKFN